MNNGGMIRMVVGIISIAVAFIIFPIVMDAVTEVTGHANIAVFTGLSSVANIAPLVIFVGLLFGGSYGIYTGYKQMR